MRKRTIWVPQELGRSCRLLGRIPGGRYRVTNSRPIGACTRSAAGAKSAEWNRGTAKRRQRSAAGRAAGSHSALIVPVKLGNATRAGPSGGKRGTESWNRFEKHDECLENSTNVSTKQKRIAELAKQSPQMAFTSLAYLMDIDWLKEALPTHPQGRGSGRGWRDLRPNTNRIWRITSNRLLDRAKSGTYRAPPVRRVHIPKGGSTTETRPIGIPTLEDKILQRAVVMLLEPIYEQDFLGLLVRLPARDDRRTRRWTSLVETDDELSEAAGF